MDRAPTEFDDETTGCMMGMDWAHETPEGCDCYKAESVAIGAAKWRKIVTMDEQSKIKLDHLPPITIENVSLVVDGGNF